MIISKDLVISKLPKRPNNANKGTFGKALILAGSKNYPGAAILSVMAAARSGAGLITLATDENTYKVVVPKIPFAAFLHFSEIKNNLEKYDAILIGPGLGQSEEIKNLMNEKNFQRKKLILDADALNIISKIPDWYKVLKSNAILTPHPGEMSRLTSLEITEIQNNREEVSKKFSKLWSKAIILKGANTIIANPEGEIYESEFANPLLATAGTGDVLSGVIVGLMAQGLDLVDASSCGVYIHGLAGDLLREKFIDRGATALDLVEKIPEVFKRLNKS